MLSHAVAVQIPKELNTKEAVENPEEDEEESDIVNLLARPLEDLVEPRLGHREAEARPDEADHDERPVVKQIMPSKMEVASQHWTDWTDWNTKS